MTETETETEYSAEYSAETETELRFGSTLLTMAIVKGSIGTIFTLICLHATIAVGMFLFSNLFDLTFRSIIVYSRMLGRWQGQPG